MVVLFVHVSFNTSRTFRAKERGRTVERPQQIKGVLYVSHIADFAVLPEWVSDIIDIFNVSDIMILWVDISLFRYGVVSSIFRYCDISILRGQLRGQQIRSIFRYFDIAWSGPWSDISMLWIDISMLRGQPRGQCDIIDFIDIIDISVLLTFRFCSEFCDTFDFSMLAMLWYYDVLSLRYFGNI